MFYTKYRPQKFDQLFGLEPIAQALTSQLEKKQVGHAYLFHGPRGTGKTSAARILAKEVGCAGLDLIEIDAASNRGIDDIRSLREKINLAPAVSRKKVYIIDEVHMLTKEAFNALLKTLEEPPPHAMLILCTTEPHKVPETIRSRCQKFGFRRASVADIVKKLKFIVEQEKANISEEDLVLLAKNAEGGFRDAETMLEQMVVGGLPAAEVVGLAPSVGEGVADFVELLLEGKVGEAIKFVNRRYEEGSNLVTFNQTLLEYLRGLLLIQVEVGEELLEAPEENYKRMKKQSSKISVRKLNFMLEEFTRSAEEVASATIPQLPLELVVISICESAPLAPAPLPQGPTILRSRPARASDGPPERSLTRDPAVAEKIVASPDIVSKWGNVLQAIKPFNHSLEALLRSARPIRLEDGVLTLEVFYKFHKEKLEQIRNRSLLEKVAGELAGVPLKVRCILGKKKDEPRSGGDDFDTVEKSALEVFNGEL